MDTHCSVVPTYYTQCLLSSYLYTYSEAYCSSIPNLVSITSPLSTLSLDKPIAFYKVKDIDSGVGTISDATKMSGEQ